MSEGAVYPPVTFPEVAILPDPPLPALVSVDATPVLARPRPAVLISGLVRTARPRQWVKNLLVFAAPGAAGVLTHGDALTRSLVTFGVFCLAASGMYFVNDYFDREHDRRHPVKRHRPVAAGDIAGGVAVATGAALCTAALIVTAAVLGWQVAAAVAVYLGINVAYNLRLRYEPVLDLAAVAAGFVIRAVAGGLATGVELSEWFIVVVSFASLFVVAGKRQPATEESSERIAYPAAFLRHVRLLASGVALTSYCVWAFEKAAAVSSHGGAWFELTIVPFALAILRYALLVEQDGDRAPEELLLQDGTMGVLVVLWAALFATGVYA